MKGEKNIVFEKDILTDEGKCRRGCWRGGKHLRYRKLGRLGLGCLIRKEGKTRKVEAYLHLKRGKVTIQKKKVVEEYNSRAKP